MDGKTPSGATKRKAYLVWFCVAVAIDAGIGISSGVGYRPSLVGLAIMLTAVLFFAWSWFKER